MLRQEAGGPELAAFCNRPSCWRTVVGRIDQCGEQAKPPRHRQRRGLLSLATRPEVHGSSEAAVGTGATCPPRARHSGLSTREMSTSCSVIVARRCPLPPRASARKRIHQRAGADAARLADTLLELVHPLGRRSQDAFDGWYVGCSAAGRTLSAGKGLSHRLSSSEIAPDLSPCTRTRVLEVRHALSS